MICVWEGIGFRCNVICPNYCQILHDHILYDFSPCFLAMVNSVTKMSACGYKFSLLALALAASFVFIVGAGYSFHVSVSVVCSWRQPRISHLSLLKD